MIRFYVLSLVTLSAGIASFLGLESSASAQNFKPFTPKIDRVIRIAKDGKKDMKKDGVQNGKKLDVRVIKTDGTKIVRRNGVVDDPAKDPLAKGDKVGKAIEIIGAVKDLIQGLRGNGGGGGDIGGGGFGGGGDVGSGGADPASSAPPVTDDSTASPKKDVVDEKASSDDDKAKDNTAKSSDGGDKVVEGEREQVFTRRLVKVKNDTDLPIKVYVQFRGLEDKKWIWIPAAPTEAQDALVFELQPGQERFLNYRNEKIAASRMRIWGVGESQSWLDYRDKDLWAVPETDPRGEHRYLAAEMRTFTHVFTPQVVGDK